MASGEIVQTFLGLVCRVAHRVRRTLWMDERLQTARASALGQHRDGWPEYRLANAALRQADAMRLSGPLLNPCILLYRDALRLLLAARTAHGDSAQDVEAARLLSEHSDIVLARLTTSDARQASLNLRRTARGLAQPFDRQAAELRRIWLARIVRVGILAVLTLACAFFYLHRPNLAKGMLVTLSHADPGFSDASLLVDGDTRKFAFHDNGPAPHSATIDLGETRRISKVTVYNRSDCCPERAVPLRIEVGDGGHFVEVAKRGETFDKWVASFAATRGRFVRLTSTNPGPFHLNEVEVY